MVNIDNAHKAPPISEAEAIKRKFSEFKALYEKGGKDALIEKLGMLYIETRRLSITIEKKNNEIKRLEGLVKNEL